MTAEIGFIPADWPAPATVRAGTTTRRGGVSQGPYESLNLGDRAGDDAEAVAANRRRLNAALDLPASPAWLWQAHGTRVVRAEDCDDTTPAADAGVARRAGVVCAVLTADCLPVLLADTQGEIVAAAHCGWRGLAAGMLAETVRAMARPGADLHAWLGPAIGPDAFEVGEDVRAAFVGRDPAHERHFRPGEVPGKHFADLYGLARDELSGLGVDSVHGGGWCTYADPARFYSYRRDRVCGRMASVIWRTR